jgi:hypothetical protein
MPFRRPFAVAVPLLCSLAAGSACPRSGPRDESGTPSAEPSAEPAPAPVAIELASAGALRQSGGGLLVRCNATLINRTGDALQVRTSFNSPFDGIELVLADAAGAEILRWAYIRHQSPFSEGTDRPLPPGETTRTLNFPIDGFRGPFEGVRARLEGGLPGTPYDTGLRSESVPLRVSADTEREP